MQYMISTWTLEEQHCTKSVQSVHTVRTREIPQPLALFNWSDNTAWRWWLREWKKWKKHWKTKSTILLVSCYSRHLKCSWLNSFRCTSHCMCRCVIVPFNDDTVFQQSKESYTLNSKLGWLRIQNLDWWWGVYEKTLREMMEVGLLLEALLPVQHSKELIQVEGYTLCIICLQLAEQKVNRGANYWREWALVGETKCENRSSEITEVKLYLKKKLRLTCPFVRILFNSADDFLKLD